jgi:cholesterol oxidase
VAIHWRNVRGLVHESIDVTLCGECVVGCNIGAKNTLDLTYLSLAKNMRPTPADIRTLCEVREFRPLSKREIEVDYVVHKVPNPGEKREPPTEQRLTCSRLILAAGTFGSSHLMLKNYSNFNIDPKHVGTRFSGNGDLLSFALNCTRREGDRVVPWRFDPTRGPTITTALREADRLDTGKSTDGPGFYIEDAGFPKELAWLIEGFNVGGWFARGVRFLRQMYRKMFGCDRDSDLGAELSELLGSADLSSRTLPLLAMGRDVPDGSFHLTGKRLQLKWKRDRSAEYFDRVEATAKALAEELGGKFLQHIPTYIFRRAVTVHPLGGCPMGETCDDGVVDPFGRTFANNRLFVIDGSILPGPVGPNPAFTIAAVADRAATRMLDGWQSGS